MICNLCPHKCNANRNADSGDGFCKMGTNPVIAKAAPHYWEEPCISGTNGSGTIFFSGCTMKCVYCQNYEISAQNNGKKATAYDLATCYKDLESQGVNNINLVSATQFTSAIVNSMKIYKPKIPVVFNCGGYENVETLKMLDGIVDVYLPDFKYSDNALALQYSKAHNYVKIATEAINEMVRQVGSAVINENGIIEKGVIVRHLILPNHTKNSIGVLDIINKNFHDDVLVSLMGQYIPHGKADEFNKLNRKITKREYNKVLNYLIDCGLDGFAQELNSANEKYIPQWDF